MAIGLARMLNVRFPLNFASPYKARDIADVLAPLAHHAEPVPARLRLHSHSAATGRGEARRNVNLMATMLLGGLWHGAAWNFVLWGGLHGLFLIVHASGIRVAASCPACRPMR